MLSPCWIKIQCLVQLQPGGLERMGAESEVCGPHSKRLGPKAWGCTGESTILITLQSRKHTAFSLATSASDLSGVAVEFRTTQLIQFTSQSWFQTSSDFPRLPTKSFSFFFPPWNVCSPFSGITISCLDFSP